jgi:NAD+ kinase
MKVGIISKNDKEALKYLSIIEDFLFKNKIEVYYDDEIAQIVGKKNIMWNEKDLDFIIWLGGDGTLLVHVNKLVGYNSKLLGIKFGSVGFLCEVDPSNLEENLKKLLKGDFKIEKRKLIEIFHEGRVIYALNEVLIHVSNIGKVSTFSINMNDTKIFSGRCDGIIISSSLGSTAYIASRNGPIIDPNLDVFVVDPLNPLKWGSRVLVVPFYVNLEVSSDKDFITIIDGNIKRNCKANEVIRIKGSNKSLNFIRFSNKFYDKIRIRSVLDI